MPLAPGTRLGPYEILGPLGAGGMGEVHRARDTRLDRVVAVKTLPLDVSADPLRRQRLEREARAVASLKHPHICALYDVGEHDGAVFLVMELIDGTTLAERLTGGAMPLDDVLACAIQIAEALDAAHRHGIVHRDLKPGNVMLTRGARPGPPHATLLDFGLAKIASDEAGPIHDAPTVLSPVTREGEILGTLHYIAPEQLEGRPIDARADIFAFGAILFEMLTGRRAFAGTSQASVIGAILHTPPPAVTDLAPGVPRALSHLVGICLEKDPAHRWASMHDVLLQLKAMAREPAASPAADASRGNTRERLAWTVAAVAAAAALGLTVFALSDRDAAPDAAGRTMLSVLPPDGAILAYGEAPQVSPDGTRLAFVAREGAGSTRIFVRDLDGAAARPVRGTEHASMPFWAPDSRRLGFFAQGQVRTVDLAGGPVQTLAPAPVPRGGAWSTHDEILFVAVPNQPPTRVPAGGGPAVPVPVSEGVSSLRWFPSFLPDGRHYLYLAARRGAGDVRYLTVGSLDTTETWDLGPIGASAVYAEPGFLLFRREGALVAQPFDLASRQLRGSPRPIVDDVGYNVISYQGLFSASSNGVLVFQDSKPGSQLTWFDRDGRRLGPATPPGDQNNFCLMADESRIVYEMADVTSGSVDLWMVDGADRQPTRLTFHSDIDFYPQCAPAGDDIVFASLRDGPPNIWRLPVGSPGSESLILQSPVAKIPSDWSRADLVFFSVLNRETFWDIHVLSLADGSTRPVVETRAEERNAQISRDGRWLAYVSNESGTFEVYVQPFPLTSARWQVSQGGGRLPQWAGSGREIYYMAPDTSLVSRSVTVTAAGLTLGEPRVLMRTNVTGWETANHSSQYRVTSDGRRVLVNTVTDAVRSISVVLNWTTASER